MLQWIVAPAGFAHHSHNPTIQPVGLATDRLEKMIAKSLMGWELVNGGEGQNRTVDTTIFSRMLYQLSYLATRATQNHSMAVS
jgi:hypothetical protein